MYQVAKSFLSTYIAVMHVLLCMKAEMNALAVEKDIFFAEYSTAKAKVREYEISKQNVNALLSVPQEPEQQRIQELE